MYDTISKTIKLIYYEENYGTIPETIELLPWKNYGSS